MKKLTISQMESFLDVNDRLVESLREKKDLTKEEAQLIVKYDNYSQKVLDFNTKVNNLMRKRNEYFKKSF